MNSLSIHSSKLEVLAEAESNKMKHKVENKRRIFKRFPITNGSLLHHSDITNTLERFKIICFADQQNVMSWLLDLRQFQESESNSILVSKPIPKSKVKLNHLSEQEALQVCQIFPGFILKQNNVFG